MKAPLHSSGDASRLSALFVGCIYPICALLSPCQADASPLSVPRAVSPRAPRKPGGHVHRAPRTSAAAGTNLATSSQPDGLRCRLSGARGESGRTAADARFGAGISRRASRPGRARVACSAGGAAATARSSRSRGQPARIPEPLGQPGQGHVPVGAAQGPGNPGRSARLPLQLPGLGGRGDGPPAGGRRGGAGARRPQPGRGGLCPVGPVRAAAAADGRLGVVHRRASGRLVAALIRCRGMLPSC